MAIAASMLVAPETHPTLRRILFPTDLSEKSDQAFAHARLLAEAFGATLVLYHAVEEPAHAEPHWAFDHALDCWRAAERVARHDLARRASGLAVPHELVVERRSGAPRALVDLVRTSQPDLVVMATHGREGLAHLFLGSVAEEVMRQGHRPVLCVRQPSCARGYRRILVPTDPSAASRRAFPLAALLAHPFGAEVLAMPQAGHDWRSIVRVAESEQADLVVMSTGDHDSPRGRILGSSAERVVRHAPCPVVVD
jgi:nucleotide-binding universal stress UspA family protein